MKLSVLICCADAAGTLPAALASVTPWAEEVLVVDSGSSDDTPQIAADAGATVIEEPWRGYSEQKEFGITRTRNPWTFVLDGDEEADATLQRELAGLDDAFAKSVDLAWMRRKNYVFGRWVRAWSPDWQSRLFHRDRVSWTGHVLHDQREASRPDAVRRLRGHLLHKRTSEAGFEDYFSGARLDARLTMQAEQMFARGKRAGFFDLAVRPGATMFKQLVIKRGLLDGSFGWMMAQKTANTTQLKYAALKAVELEKRVPPTPDASETP